MRKEAWLKAGKEERDNYVVKFVSELLDKTSRITKADRDRWLLAEKMFRGEQPISSERAKSPWMSSPFLHEMSATVRRAAAALQDLIFQGDDYFGLESSGQSEEELGLILHKVVRAELDRLNFPVRSYDAFLIGSIYGIVFRKLTVASETEWVPERVIEGIEEDSEKDASSLSSDIAKKTMTHTIPTDPEEIRERLATSFDELFGPSKKKEAKRDLKPQKRLRLAYQLDFPNPFNLFWDPDARDVNDSSYFIERHFVHYHKLVKMAESAAISMDELEKLKGSNFSEQANGSGNLNDSYTGQAINQRDQVTEPAATMPTMEVLEYWGPLLDEQGDILEENMCYLIGNRKVVLKGKRNGYFSQKAPYHAAVFSRVPFKAVGQGVADNSIEQNIIINDLFGLWVDLMKLATYSPKTFDATKLVDPRQVEGYLKPGQLIDVMNSTDQIFRDIPFNVNGVGGPLFQTIEALRLSGEKGTGVDTTGANPSSRARISAAEIQSNQGRASQSLLAIGREVDANYLVSTLRALFECVLQFGFNDENLALLVSDGVLTESEYELVKQIPMLSRYNEIRRHWRFKIKGFRERLERDEFIGKTNELLSVLTRIPPGLVNLNYSALLKQYLQSLNFDVDAILPQNTPQDKAREENSLLSRPGNQQISVGDEDNHSAELPVHYEEAMKNPTQGLLQHIMGHIQASGGQFPPPPPQVGQMLGIPQQEAPQGQTIQ